MWFRRLWSDARGFSVTETMTTLTAVTLLSTVAAPTVGDYIDSARFVRAQHDARTLATSFVRLMTDVSPERHIDGGWATYDLLVGPGEIPQTRSADTRPWARKGPRVGLLEEQLNVNGPGYSSRTFPNVFGWRGAYLQDPIKSDPWGHRYAVNVAALHGEETDTIVLSPGPDGVAAFPFMSDGLPTSGDDVTAHVASAGNMAMRDRR